jgi:hypothetical protein
LMSFAARSIVVVVVMRLEKDPDSWRRRVR